MQYLIKRGLLNTGLVELTTVLRDRYNDALESLGIAPTRCKRIFVDGAGWSPQVAQEKENNYYLCSGSIINPVAIIVSPAQYKKPVFFPAFSWMRRAMRQVFSKYHREIHDVTTTHPIAIDCENGLSSLECPGDLLLLDTVRMRPMNGNLTEIAAEQNARIARFRAQLNCLEPEVCDAVVEHRLAHGDLRKRRLDMRPVVFDACNDFYTPIFGGAAVVRSVDGSDMLIIEDAEAFEAMQGSARCGSSPAWYLYDDKKKTDPIRQLMRGGLIGVPLDAFRQDPRILEEKKQLMLSFALCDCEDGIDWGTCSSSKQKALYSKHEDRVSLYAELERFAAAVRKGQDLPELSFGLELFLMTPAAELPTSTKEVLWILLTRREPRNILELYTHDKNHFVAQYKKWSKAKQKWVADYLAARYEPRMLEP